MNVKHIYLGADHAGWKMKEALKGELSRQGFGVRDLGAPSLDPNDDYPDFGEPVAKAVTAHPGSRGIVLCGNAQGMCIVANKVKGIRAVTGFSMDAAKTSRTDDDANVLCLPGRMLSATQAKKIVRMWLTTRFSGATRHKRRLQKIKRLESKHYG
jgi:ribose 5-phosphate isomerase B